MNRKRIVLQPVSLDQRNVLEELHGYRQTINTYQLSAAIVSSPEYDLWQDLLADVRPDVVDGVGSEIVYKRERDRVRLLWVPGSMPIQDGERRFKYRASLDGLFDELTEFAEEHGNMLVQYGPEGLHVPHDRLTFKRDTKGTIYCVRAAISTRHIADYRHTNEFPPTERGEQVYAYYHERR